MKENTGVTQHTNGGDGTSPAVVGHPPDLANIEPEASACHLKIRADAVGIHASASVCSREAVVEGKEIRQEGLRSSSCAVMYDWRRRGSRWCHMR